MSYAAEVTVLHLGNVVNHHGGLRRLLDDVGADFYNLFEHGVVDRTNNTEGTEILQIS